MQCQCRPADEATPNLAGDVANGGPQGCQARGQHIGVVSDPAHGALVEWPRRFNSAVIILDMRRRHQRRRRFYRRHRRRRHRRRPTPTANTESPPNTTHPAPHTHTRALQVGGPAATRLSGACQRVQIGAAQMLRLASLRMLLVWAPVVRIRPSLNLSPTCRPAGRSTLPGVPRALPPFCFLRRPSG